MEVSRFLQLEKPREISDCPGKHTIESVNKKQWKYESNQILNRIENHLSLVETDNFLLRFDFGNSIWAMCVKDIFTLDIDVKDGITKQDAIDILQKYVDFMHSHSIDMLFQIVESDRGIHAYLVSEKLMYGSEESVKLSLDMCSDIHYIIFSTFNGFCSRVAPKIIKEEIDQQTGKKTGYMIWRTDEEIYSEFVGKPCYRNDNNGQTSCFVGYGIADPDIEKYMNIYFKLIEKFIDYYRINLEYFKLRRSIEFDGIQYTHKWLPPVKALNEIREFAIKILEENGLESTGRYRVSGKNPHWIDSYSKYLEKKTIRTCALLEASDINRRVRESAMESWKRECNWQIISVGGLDVLDDPRDNLMPPKRIMNASGKSYPFVFGINALNRMVFIQFSNLFMGDWDVKDGYPKESPISIVEDYFKYEKDHPDDRLFKGFPRFKWYESDNGTHGYCVGGPLHYNEYQEFDYKKYRGLNRSMEFMRRLCIDEWYIVFVKFRGYSVRIGPKMGPRPLLKDRNDLDSNGYPIFEYFDDEIIRNQFVQKEGISIKTENGEEKVLYTGAGEVDPYLNSLTEMIMELKTKVLKHPGFYEKIDTDMVTLSAELGEYAKEIYDRLCRKHEVDMSNKYLDNLNYWANTIWRCPVSLERFNSDL